MICNKYFFFQFYKSEYFFCIQHFWLLGPHTLLRSICKAGASMSGRPLDVANVTASCICKELQRHSTQSSSHVSPTSPFSSSPEIHWKLMQCNVCKCNYSCLVFLKCHSAPGKMVSFSQLWWKAMKHEKSDGSLNSLIQTTSCMWNQADLTVWAPEYTTKI